MLKEQVAEILDSIEKVARTGVMLPKNHYRDQILNLFKAEVDKLELTDEEIEEKLENDWDGLDQVSLIPYVIEHTKKQLLEGLASIL